ncbi:MAG: hypothetical protein GXP31_02350 [Kiritimatiellaeota bacterium]|nr:hypothetical protein [Kiritimatiellota bacterium]
MFTRIAAVLTFATTGGALLPAPRLNAQVNAHTPGWFPFVMSPVDTPDNAALDMSFLNTPGGRGRIRVQDGRFVDGQGRRVRFLGTNCTFSGAFPEKADAPKIARRLAQLGFNVVRFHHMDARDIWLPGQKGLDPAKLDRLAWFLHNLKQNGIYANINLHVSRTYPALRRIRDLPRSFRYGKILDIFYEPFIRLQEQYASDLLGYRNAYTGFRLADDPEIAFVELNNENTLLNLKLGQLDSMPEPFRDALRDKWRQWLKRRYTTLPAARKNWDRGAVPLGPELLKNADFARGAEGWTLEGEKPGVCEATSAKAPDGRPALRVRIAKKGKVSWAYQLHQIGVPAKNGQTYTIAFRARANPPRTLGVSMRFAKAPWTVVSRHSGIACTPKWKEYVIVTGVKGVIPDMPIRLSFNMGDMPGEVEFAAISLRTGRRPLDISARNLDEIELPASYWPDAAAADFRRFLIDTEQAYVKRLRRHLRDKVGLKALIADTQAGYGGLWGLRREGSLSDYVDNHSYWQHPRFPGRPWDSKNWFIPNTSMAADPKGGTFRRLTLYRYAGKPYSISEYNHPAPNDHAAEMFPLLATYAAHQDWDAIYQFSYLNRAEYAHRDKINGYFELSHHSAQLVFAPIAAVAFRAFGVPAAPEKLVVDLPVELLDKGLETGWPSADSLLPLERLVLPVVLSNRFAVRFDTTLSQVRIPALPDPPPDGFLLRTPIMEWTPAPRALYRVAAPALRVAVGEIGGAPLELGDVRLTVRSPEGSWACVALAALDGKSVADSAKLLFVAVTRAENSNMEWDAKRTTVLNKWGSGPVVAQGLPADLTLPGAARPRVHALDPHGVRAAPVDVRGAPGTWRIAVGPKFRTLWYLVER